MMSLSADKSVGPLNPTSRYLDDLLNIKINVSRV